MKVVWTKESISKLKEIEEYISEDNPTIAVKFVNKLISIAESVIDNPQRGRVVSEILNKNIREVLYKNYRIVYLIKNKSIIILTVFEGHQQLKLSDRFLS